MHYHTAGGQWAAQLLQCTATLPEDRGQCNSCSKLPHRPRGSWQWNFCDALPHCLWAVGTATPPMQCHAAQGQLAVELLQCTAILPGGSGQCNSCSALP